MSTCWTMETWPAQGGGQGGGPARQAAARRLQNPPAPTPPRGGSARPRDLLGDWRVARQPPDPPGDHQNPRKLLQPQSLGLGTWAKLHRVSILWAAERLHHLTSMLGSHRKSFDAALTSSVARPAPATEPVVQLLRLCALQLVCLPVKQGPRQQQAGLHSCQKLLPKSMHNSMYGCILTLAGPPGRCRSCSKPLPASFSSRSRSSSGAGSGPRGSAPPGRPAELPAGLFLGRGCGLDLPPRVCPAGLGCC